MADRSMLLSLLPLRQCDYDLMPGMPPKPDLLADVHLDSITTNQAAIIALFRVVNRYVGNLAPMPGVFPDYPEPVVRNPNAGSGPPVTNIRNTSSPPKDRWPIPNTKGFPVG